MHECRSVTRNPPHLGELFRESMDDVGWNVTGTAARLGCDRGTLSRLLNGKAGVSANMALALERFRSHFKNNKNPDQGLRPWTAEVKR